MRRLLKYAIVLGALLGAISCSEKKVEEPAPVLPDEATVRLTTEGEVIGFVTDAGAHSWRGLPYAAPPVGELRWRAPRPAQGWDGARIATEFGSRCPQYSNYLNAGEGLEPGIFLGSEDCLFLDIYAPPNAQDKKLPVMVWIHGGSNVWGRSASYDGSRLAINEDVIIVPVQYRIGPFGYFSHPLIRGSAQTADDAAANFAVLDLIAALRWVEANIAEFGGDPENVTIFGESAGAFNIAQLLVAPDAEGLFDKAILQSGGFDSVSVEQAEGADSKLANPSETIVSKLGATTAADMRAASVDEIFAAYDVVERGYVELPTVIEDGVSIPATPLRDALSSTDTFHDVPIITGVNRDEMKLFQLADPRLTKKILGIFLAPRDKDFYNAVSDYPSRIWRVRSVDRPATTMAAAGHEDVYAYRFDWDEGGRFLFSDMSVLFGAAHALEIPFVFNRFVFFGEADKILFQKKTEASRAALANAMGAYWGAFARDGAPGAPVIDAGDNELVLPYWPRWSEGGELMRFDSENDKGVGMFNEPDSIDRIIADLKADPRLSEAERCDVVDAIAEWLDELASEIGGAIGCNA